MTGHEDAVTSWQDTMAKPWPVVVKDATEGEEAGFLVKCDQGWRETDASIVGYLHSDLYTLESGWDARVLNEFHDPSVGVVGFVGATALGHPDIYRVPYDFRQLARYGVISNLTDAEVHGARETGSRNVAVVDSCAVFVRRSFLHRIGGWPVAVYPNSSHCSDLWISASAHRAGMRVRVCGVRSVHKSGGKGQVGSHWLNQHGTDEVLHRQAHQLIYEDFRQELPLRVP
jgi:hypothetical protein